MTERQEKFCREYAKSGNGAEAYRLAGYKAKTNHAASVGADRLLANDDIKRRVKELTEIVKDADIADIKEIQRFLTSVLRGEQPEKRTFGSDALGNVIAEDVINQAHQIKCAELLAKMQGAFLSVDVKNEGGTTVVIVDDLGG